MSEVLKANCDFNTGVRLEFAPMEGITGFVFRQAHSLIYGGVDRYYSPFIAPGSSHKLSSRERNDILPENNEGICLIPQILTHSSEDFLWICRELAEYGYDTVNLNLGCPSATVVTKKKGAGFLSEPNELNIFFEEVCDGLEKIHTSDGKTMRLSVKTRIGMKEESEFFRLLEIYNQYPLEELIIHPRLREDYYNGSTRMEIFRYALKHSKNRLCYNGNLFTHEDVTNFMGDFIDGKTKDEDNHKLSGMMIGRGGVANPWIFDKVMGIDSSNTAKKFKEFHDHLLEGYEKIMSGDRNTLFKMKELWSYFKCHFPDCEKELKKIKKAQKISDYRSAVQSLFHSQITA